MPYLRRRTESGGRVANIALERSGDDLIWEAVRMYEGFQERVWGEYADLLNDRS